MTLRTSLSENTNISPVAVCKSQKTREEDKVGDFGESRGLNPQKRVLRYEVLRALGSCIVESINFSDHETYRHELQRVRM